MQENITQVEEKKKLINVIKASDYRHYEQFKQDDQIW